VLLATVEPGQEVVICDPVYAGLVNRIRLAGGVPRFVSCTPARPRAPGPAPTSGPKSCIRCANAAAAVISCGRMLLGRLTGDTAAFREISAKHWHRPALVFNGRAEDTFEIQLAQLSERTAGRAHPGDRRPLVLRLATGRQSREALAAPGAIRNNEHSG
jgi:hypothetical protein